MVDLQSLYYAIASSLQEQYITNVHGLLFWVIHVRTAKVEDLERGVD